MHKNDMNKLPLVSIIIPVYNVEQYLDKCIQSVLEQEYENIEIILVDDGATDSSGKMCDEYSKRDGRVKVIHKENGGLSDARNVGLKEMTGEYFSFVDSDDYVCPGYVSKMYEHIVKDKSDLVVCMLKKVLDDEECTNVLSNNVESTIYDREQIKYQMLSRRVPMYAPGKLFAASLAKDAVFPVGRLYEDVPTIWNIVKHVQSVSCVSNELYFYRQRIGSIVNTKYKHERMDLLYFSEDILSEVVDDNKLSNIAKSRCFFAAADNFTLVTKEYPDDEKYLIEAIKKYRKATILEKSSGLSLRIMARISYISPRLVRVLGRLYKQYNYIKWNKGIDRKESRLKC